MQTTKNNNPVVTITNGFNHWRQFKKNNPQFKTLANDFHHGRQLFPKTLRAAASKMDNSIPLKVYYLFDPWQRKK